MVGNDDALPVIDEQNAFRECIQCRGKQCRSNIGQVNMRGLSENQEQRQGGAGHCSCRNQGKCTTQREIQGIEEQQ